VSYVHEGPVGARLESLIDPDGAAVEEMLLHGERAFGLTLAHERHLGPFQGFGKYAILARVARFFLRQYTKMGKIYQIAKMAIKYTKWP
jgi:hypothetical protein